MVTGPYDGDSAYASPHAYPPPDPAQQHAVNELRVPDEHGHYPKPGTPPPPPDPKAVDMAWPAGRSSWAARALARSEANR